MIAVTARLRRSCQLAVKELRFSQEQKTVRYTLLLALCFTIEVLTCCAQPSQANPCSTPEYHRFDFWAGDWDAFEAGSSSPVARTKVDRILDGCVLREDYQDTSGHKGRSFTIYDASRKLWHQTWVTNRGELLVIEGRLEGNDMMLSGSDRTSDGKERLVRGTWRPVGGGVREFAARSLDGGKTWKEWFDITFLAHKE
jgi:hypothetical protein